MTSTVLTSPKGMRWWRLLVLVGLCFSAVGARACERYVPQFQSFPALDWIEALPILDESAALPSAETLAAGVVFAGPDVPLVQGVRPYQPRFTLPGVVVRQVSGLRDAARSEKLFLRTEAPVEHRSVRLHVLVFRRAWRAEAWADLRATQLDLGRRGTIEPKSFRTSGPDSLDSVWIEEPASSERPEAGHVTVVGARGVVAFEVDVLVLREGLGGPGGDAALVADAEALGRQVAREWTTWLRDTHPLVPRPRSRPS